MSNYTGLLRNKESLKRKISSPKAQRKSKLSWKKTLSSIVEKLRALRNGKKIPVIQYANDIQKVFLRRTPEERQRDVKSAFGTLKWKDGKEWIGVRSRMSHISKYVEVPVSI